MNKFYTGVGSRNTPEHIMIVMTKIATKLEQLGYSLRSGAADGADTAFESGVLDNSNKQIFIAWEGFSNRNSKEIGVFNVKGQAAQQAEEIASIIHPAWDKLSRGARGLHSRNIFQCLGATLDTPSKFLICYAEVDKNGIPKGGTRTAWVCATNNSIPCFNLLFEEDMKRLIKFVGEYSC